jgi:hypothetical protein
VSEAHSALHESVHSWGQLLIATGGVFKPPRCFFCTISFAWSDAGRWSCAKNDNNEKFDIAVSMPDIYSAPIEHILVDESKVTLGIPTCPPGKAAAHLKAMQVKRRSG